MVHVLGAGVRKNAASEVYKQIAYVAYGNTKISHRNGTWLVKCLMFLEKLIVTRLINKFATFSGTRSFIIVFNPPLDPILSQMNTVYSLITYLYDIHLGITPSKPKSPKWSLSFIFSN
jgi:hypothetical protein